MIARKYKKKYWVKERRESDESKALYGLI